MAQPPAKALCAYCENMDVEQMVCDPHGVYDLSSIFPSPLSYRRQGYLHHSNYPSLEKSAKTCEICNAMVIEIIRYLTNDLTPFWQSRLSFIKSRLESADSQIYLHFPTSKAIPGRGFAISCRSGFFDDNGDAQDFAKIGYKLPSDYDPDSDSDLEDRGHGLPKAFIVGKMGMFLARLTAAATELARREEQRLLRGEEQRPQSENTTSHDGFRLKLPPLGWEIADNPLSDASIEKARGWLTNCHKNHKLCNTREVAPTMPTRLIEVSLDEHPRLITTAKGKHYTYIALSHCWGGHVALTTTGGTLEAHQKEIPLKDFPATFRDAVVFTRKLGIRYIWIDSLCIIQQNKEDWSSEGRIMGDIFKNSALTLSATTAKNSTAGFLHPRTPRFQPIHLQHGSINPYLNTTLIIRPWLMSWTRCVDGDMSPLSSRGWVLQERLLPPRTLHFGHEQMFFECRTELVQEAQDYDTIDIEDGRLYFDLGSEWELNKVFLFPRGAEERIDFVLNGDRYKSAAQLERFRQRRENGSEDWDLDRKKVDVHQSWFNLVQNYTSRNLTYQSDKLIAISGAARAMQALVGTNDEYVAGIWRSRLHDGLIWATKRSGKRSTEYLAPSWSWASMCSVVSFEKTDQESPPTWDFAKLEQTLLSSETSNINGKAEIYSAHILLENAGNPYGQVREGSYLEISGPWIRIAVEFETSVSAEYIGYETDRSSYITWASSVLPTVAISEGKSFTLAFSDDEEEPTCYYSGAEHDGCLYFPALTTTRRSPHDPNLFTGDAMRFSLDEGFQASTFDTHQSFYIFELQHVVSNYFLILRSFEGELGLYRRIGLAECIQLPGNKLGLLGHLSKMRRIRIL